MCFTSNKIVDVKSTEEEELNHCVCFECCIYETEEGKIPTQEIAKRQCFNKLTESFIYNKKAYILKPLCEKGQLLFWVFLIP